MPRWPPTSGLPARRAQNRLASAGAGASPGPAVRAAAVACPPSATANRLHRCPVLTEFGCFSVCKTKEPQERLNSTRVPRGAREAAGRCIMHARDARGVCVQAHKDYLRTVSLSVSVCAYRRYREARTHPSPLAAAARRGHLGRNKTLPKSLQSVVCTNIVCARQRNAVQCKCGA